MDIGFDFFPYNKFLPTIRIQTSSRQICGNFYEKENVKSMLELL